VNKLDFIEQTGWRNVLFPVHQVLLSVLFLNPHLCAVIVNMIKGLICFWVGLFGFQALHPLHVSVTEINYDEKDKALEIMVRIFVDDLETTMRKNQNIPDLDITKPKGPTLDEMMQKYLQESLVVSLDGKRQTIKYLGNERDGEAFVFYIEVPGVKKWKKIGVSNSILTEVFDDQSNLVHVTSAGTVLSLRLNKSNPSGILEFQQ
jgi:hypothetical protein